MCPHQDTVYSLKLWQIENLTRFFKVATIDGGCKERDNEPSQFRFRFQSTMTIPSRSQSLR